MEQIIKGKTLEKWIEDLPLIEDVINLKETFWQNAKRRTSCLGYRWKYGSRK